MRYFQQLAKTDGKNEGIIYQVFKCIIMGILTNELASLVEAIVQAKLRQTVNMSRLTLQP